MLSKKNKQESKYKQTEEINSVNKNKYILVQQIQWTRVTTTNNIKEYRYDKQKKINKNNNKNRLYVQQLQRGQQVRGFRAHRELQQVPHHHEHPGHRPLPMG